MPKFLIVVWYILSVTVLRAGHSLDALMHPQTKILQIVHLSRPRFIQLLQEVQVSG